MEAVVLNKPREISIEEIAEPQLQGPTDVLFRLISTAICGTDLHIYEGRLGSGERMLIGHEPLLLIEAGAQWVAEPLTALRTAIDSGMDEDLAAAEEAVERAKAGPDESAP